jgi:hypothetical protein
MNLSSLQSPSGNLSSVRKRRTETVRSSKDETAITDIPAKYFEIPVELRDNIQIKADEKQASKVADEYA